MQGFHKTQRQTDASPIGLLSTKEGIHKVRMFESMLGDRTFDRYCVEHGYYRYVDVHGHKHQVFREDKIPNYNRDKILYDALRQLRLRRKRAKEHEAARVNSLTN